MFKSILHFLINKLTETSTWIGIIGLSLYIINASTLLICLFLVSIVLPESIWDTFTKDKGQQLKEYLDKFI